MVLSRSSFGKDPVKELMRGVSNGGDETTILRLWRSATPLIDPGLLTRDFASIQPEDLIRLGSSAAPVVYVDYSDQYYANAKLPWAGSANVDAKVAEDGSLSEVSAQVETKTIETLLGPVNTAIGGALGGGKNLEPGTISAFTLTITISGYRHTLARLRDYSDGSVTTVSQTQATDRAVGCPVVTTIAFADISEYKREDVSPPASDGKPGDKKSGDDAAKPNTNDKPKADSGNKDTTDDHKGTDGAKKDIAGQSSGDGNKGQKKKKKP